VGKGRAGEGRTLREHAHLSLSELAQAVGEDPAVLSRWERGSARPRPGAAIRWLEACDALGAELTRQGESVAS
jgi:transcriptional regulator with XRE-family HTH domain